MIRNKPQHCKPVFQNKYNIRFRMLETFANHPSSAPEAALRIGVTTLQGQGAATHLTKRGFANYFHEIGYMVTEKGLEALKNTPDVYRHVVQAKKRWPKRRIVAKLLNLSGGPSVRAHINSAIAKMNSSDPADKLAGRTAAFDLLARSRQVTFSHEEVTLAMKQYVSTKVLSHGAMVVNFNLDADGKVTCTVYSKIVDRD